MRQRAERYQDKIALDYCHYVQGREVHDRLTYYELDIKARAIASILQRQGVRGQRVLVLCPSGLDFVAGFFGCVYAGAVAVPVHPPVRNRVISRVSSIVADAQARFVLTTAELQAQLKDAVDGLTHENSLLWSAADAVDPAAAAEWVAPSIDASSTALMQYTSGSTNSPKGVVVTHRNLLANLDAIRAAWGHGNDDAVAVFWLPLHHDMGLIGSILETLYVGCTSYLMPPEAFIERPMRWLEAISQHRGTITTAPNFAYELCVERSTAEERAALDLSSWTTAMCGAEPVRADTLERFADAFRPAGFRPEAFNPVYGLAEATLLASGSPDWVMPVVRHVDGVALREKRVIDVGPGHPAATSFVGCGHAQRGHEIAIVDPVSLQRSAAGEVGEIWLAGGSVAEGYWGRPAETEETFSAFLADTGSGPFLRTGDLGFELDGELFVTGRLKDLIVIRGRNYYPEDIEATAQDSHRALLRGRGAAFSHTPPSGGSERLIVAQEVDRDRIADTEVSEVIDAIRTAVTEHHELQLDAVVLLEPLRIPTTSSGKIRRGNCRQRFLDGDLEVFAEWHARPLPDPGPPLPRANPAPDGEVFGAEQIAAWFVAQLSAEFGLSPTEVDTSLSFAHYGLDSVRAIRLTASLEARLGRELSPTLIYEYPTIDLLSKHLAEEALADERRTAAGATGGDRRPAGTDEPIAIVGIGCRFPGADGPAAFWRLLCDGVDAVTEMPRDRWDADAPETLGTHVDGSDPLRPASARWGGFLDQVDQFDPQFFGISPREAARMDPQQRLLLEVAWEALEDAGQVPKRLAGSRTGVFVGVSTYDYGHLQLGQPALIDAYTATGAALSIAANRLSYFYDFRGPSMTIDTACSSSLVAVHLACRSLRDGECALALVGGANVILSPALGMNFNEAGVMAADGRCKAFDSRADGYVRGEGAGIVVLKPISRALTDGDPIYAVIRGSATNQDGRTNGLMAPSLQSQEEVLAEAYRRAGLSPGVVQYVEAHGTGTSVGDAIEAKALSTVLTQGRTPDSRCLVGSVKTNIGHLEAAAGVAGLIKVALTLRHRSIPPSLHFTEPNPLIPFDSLPLHVPQTLTPWPENGGRAVAGVSAFGFGGTNAHIVLTEAPHARVSRPQDDAGPGRVGLLPLSARSPEALAALAGRYELALAAGAPLAGLCYTAGARRGHHDHRLAVVADTPAELCESLAAYRQGAPRPGLSSGRCRPDQQRGVVFVFSGQGSQWRGMGQQLYAQEPVFRDMLARCDSAMGPHLDGSPNGSVVAELLGDPTQSRRSDIGIIQPAIFAVQVALAALWRSWGVEPEAVVGHSLGEVAAAHIAGALRLEDAARVICGRARLLQRVNGDGAMLATELSPAEAQDLIGCQQGRVAVAATNSHRSTVLSGDARAIADLATELEQRGRFCRRVEVDVASHSPQMNALRADLAGALAGIQPVPAAIPIYSTVTGDLMTHGVFDAAYWVENLCAPVRFSAAMRRLLDLGHDTFLEISPHPILLGAVGEDAAELDRTCTLLPSMRRDQRERATMLASLGVFYTRGQSVAWEQLHPSDARCVAAPTYPWQRDRFWLAPDDTAAGNASTQCRVRGSAALPAATLLKPVIGGAMWAFGAARRLLPADLRQGLSAPPIAGLLRAVVGKPADAEANEREASLADALRRADRAERKRLLESYLRDQVAATFGLRPSKVDIELPLNSLGIDSLIALELRTQIERDLGIVVPVVELLNAPSVADLADRLSSTGPAESDPATTAGPEATTSRLPEIPNGAQAHPLSYGQRSLWFLYQLAPGSPAYTITYAGRISGDLDATALERAAQAIIDRHAVLRTTYAARNGQPVQLVHPRWPARVARHDVDSDELHEWIRREANRPFDLQAGPVFRLTLLRTAPDEHVLVLAVHHIAVDFWSIDVMLDELRLLYAAEHGCQAPPACPEHYVDYVDRQARMLAGAEGDRLWNYWRDQLAGELPPNLRLPLDRPRGAVQTYRGAVHRFTLDTRLADGLRELGRRTRTTPYMTLLAAYATLLHRYSGQDDLLIGSPFGCRDHAGLHNLVGYLANPVVLRADMHGNPTFTALLGRVKETVLGALAHQDYPFAMLVERLRPARDLSHTPLYQTSFAWEQPRRFHDGAGAAPGRAALDLETVHVGQGGAPMDLMMQVGDAEGQFICQLQYNTDLFDDATIERMAGHFTTLLDGIVTDPGARLSELPLLTEAERRARAAWNDTGVRYDAPECLHDMVAATVRRSPHAIAVSFGDDELTYAELDRQAEALAQRLQRLGVGSDRIVPVLLDRSADLVVTLLGVLKAGGAFMPVDPAQPVNRIAAIISNAPGVLVCVTHRRHLERLPEFTGHRLCLDLPETREPTEAAETAAVDAQTASDSLAYVSHTSGSTGVPKGALNTHGAICNLLLWMQATYQLNPDGRVLHHTPITFDASVAEIFWPLTVGARLVIARPEGHKDAAYLVQTIVEQSITAVHFTPSTLRAVLAEPAVTSCVSLRTVTCGGEALSYELAQHFLGRLDAELWNEYGPAETAVTVTAYRCERGAPGRTVPIGRPVANIRIHLLDTDLQPVPVGVPGELFIGGAAVGRGYLNRPDATAASFVTDPFGADPEDSGSPLYRTGDLARYLPDGNIEYLGRLDDQVQIRGVRIEPGEVEAALDKHPGVRENAVVAGNEGRGNTRLIAHIVAASQPAPTTAELRRFLLEWLPAAMVPAVFSIVDALPHTSSGKVDRCALAAAGESAPLDGPAFVAPRTRAEKILGDIWREVLDLERIGVHDDFFALGGSSTHSLEVAVRAKVAGLPLQPESVFLFGTIAELAAEYDRAGEGAPDLDAAQQVDRRETLSPDGESLPAPFPAVPAQSPGPQTRNTVIESIGTYLPAQAVSTDAVLAGCVNKIGIPLERLTGIKSRRVVGPGEFSIDLARNAVADCLARSSYGPDEIDLVICCNISRFDGPGQIMYEPSTAARLREQCGLANAIAFDVSNACAGMFTGVAVADAFLQTGLVQRAMVVSGEYISHIAETAQREIEGPMDPRLACLTVGDVGAAVVLERGPGDRVGFHDIDMATLSRYSKVCIAKASTGPHGGAIMTVDSIAATATAVKRSVPYVAAVMQRHGWRLENCDHILMHQTSQASINDAVFAVNRVFGHAAAHSGNVINNLAERGNTASTTHFVALHDQIQANRIKSGDNVVFGISGSGTTVGTALYTFDDLPARMRRATDCQRGQSFSTSWRPADPPSMPRVRIEGVGTAPASAPRHAVDLAVQAAGACLDDSTVDPATLDLIVYAGVYRDDFLAEPAIAALVAGELGINDDIESPNGPKTFAFDVLNGAVGFLNACHVGVQMIGAGKAEHVMVAASEVENNSGADGHPSYGLSETGSAVILGRADDAEGFGRFVFHHHPEYAEALTTYFQHRDGQSWLQIDGDPNLATHYLDCIPGAVEELLKLEELDCSEIAAVFPPYLSDADRTELAARLNIPSSRFVDLAAESDLFSSCLPYGLQRARQHNLVRPGDIGLIVSVGSGVQIGCATYRF